MGSPVLSRFDVVFILLDIPDESHDRHLSEHVMANRAGRVGTTSATVTRTNLETSILLDESDMPLSERLQVKVKNRLNGVQLHLSHSYKCESICFKVPPGESIDAIPPCLLRKYISYARQYVHPSLSGEAAQIIQEFYLSLRAQAHPADSTPVTTRQLESLIRLTEV